MPRPRPRTTDQLSEDFCTVLNHVLRDYEYYGVRAPDGRKALLVLRVIDERFNNRENLTTVLEWVRGFMDWTNGHRRLTRKETRIVAAVDRLFEAVWMFEMIDRLGAAIAAKNWPRARQVWTRLTPFHGMIVSACPTAADLATVLHDEERQSTAVH